MKFGYTIVYVASVPETLAFYERAFGFQTRFLHESGQHGELETGATALAFASLDMGEMNLGRNFVPVSAALPAPGIELAFVTEDVPQAFARATAAGATAVHPPAAKPWGQVVAYVRALEGSLIELCSPMGS